MIRRFLVLCLLVLLGASCAGPAPEGVTVYASLPLSGASAARSAALVEGIEMAFSQTGQAASACGADFSVRLVLLDNVTEGEWDATLEAAAANKAASDSTAIAYIGSFEPGPLIVSLPILNQAGPMLVLAPMNGYPPFSYPRRQPDVPNDYYPTGEANFIRLGPTDFEAGEVAAAWAVEAGAETVVVLYDLYDPTQLALQTARGFEFAAAGLGLQVLESFGIDRFAAEFDSVMDGVVSRNGSVQPSLLFYAGPPAEHLPLLFEAKRRWLGDAEQAPMLSAPGFGADLFAEAGGPGVEGTLVVSPALPVPWWPRAARSFAETYEASQAEPPAIEALYGYAAGEAVRMATVAACSAGRNPNNRREVLAAALTAHMALASGEPPRGSINRRWLPDGEFGLYRINGGALDFLEKLREAE